MANYVVTRSYLVGALVRGTEISFACDDGFGPFVGGNPGNKLTCGFDGWSPDAKCLSGKCYC